MRYVSYLRVSTSKQGQSGLGLEAQRAAINSYLNGVLLEEFVEVESGKNNNRAQLKAALEACRLKGATLIIAKLDRLSRDAHFLLGLQKAGVSFRCADMPEANELTVGIMALVAQEERKMISKRTKEALQAAKARGVTLGKPENFTDADRAKHSYLGVQARKKKAQTFAESVYPMIHEYQQEGLSLRSIARKLNDNGVLTSRGLSGSWTPAAIQRVIRNASGVYVCVGSTISGRNVSLQVSNNTHDS